MIGYVYVCGSLLLLLACPSTTQQPPSNPECVKHGPLLQNAPYPYLYRKFETALINNHTFLDDIRTYFISTPGMEFATFAVKVEVDHGENISCAADSSPNKAFCNSDSPDYNWKLCPAVVNDDEDIQFFFSTASVNIEYYFLTWLCLLHGNLLQFVIYCEWYIVTPTLFTGYYYDDYDPIPLTLKIEELKCNPSFPFVKCVLSELLSWVSCNSEIFDFMISMSLFNR